jgi:hypothetical protein
VDAVSRIIGVWVVACVFTGIVLIVANVPVGTETWNEQRTLLVRLGGVAIGLGFAGLVAELWRILPRRQVALPPPVAQPPPVAVAAESLAEPPSSPELEATRARLAELEADALAQHLADRERQLGQAEQRAGEIMQGFSLEDIDNRTTKANGFLQLEELDRTVMSIVGDVPEDVAFYTSQERAPMVWSSLSWSEHVVALAAIRKSRIQELTARTRVRAGQPF